MWKSTLVKERSDNSIEGIERGWEEAVDKRTGSYLGAQDQEAKNKEIDLVLVRWKHSLGPNLTWETKDEMMKRYPGFIDYEKIPRTESS